MLEVIATRLWAFKIFQQELLCATVPRPDYVFQDQGTNCLVLVIDEAEDVLYS